MKKVLMIASNASHFKNFHMPYIEYLSENGVQVNTAANGVLNAKGIRHTELSFRKKLFHPANIGVILRLAKAMRKESYDTVYTNSTLAGFAGRFALILSGQKSTAAVHICHGYLFSDGKSLRSRIYLAFEKLVRRRTDVLAVMNDEDLGIALKYSLLTFF